MTKKEHLKVHFKQVMNVGKLILLNVQLLDFFGVIYANNQNRKTTVSKYVRSGFFVGFCFFTMFISELINLVLVVDKLADLVSASFLFLTHLVHLIKYIHIYIYTSRIHRLINSADRKDFRPRSKQQEIILEKYATSSKYITITFLMACIATCAFWGVYPFTDRVLSLPLAGWFPFNPDNTPMFQIAFTYQIIAATINGLTNISIDTLMSGGFLFALLVTELVNIFQQKKLQEFSSALFLTMTHTAQFLKVCILLKNQYQFHAVSDKIERPEFRPKTLPQRQAVEFYTKITKILFYIAISAVVGTCMIWAIFPTTDKSFKALPLPGWYPFDTRTSPNYELTYVYQIVCVTSNGVVNVAHDLYITGLIMIICSQLHILNDSLINIRSEAEELLILDETNLTFQDAMNIKLVECVEHHKCILEFAKEFSVLFTTSILGQFVVSVIIICTTMFEMTLVPFMSLKFVSLILYQYCMLMEIFILCYFGNEVILESHKLTNFAYHSDWLVGSIKYRKNLVFFMTYSQRTLKLYAGGFFPLSLETFVRILRSSWSYFAVLLQVNKDNLVTTTT